MRVKKKKKWIVTAIVTIVFSILFYSAYIYGQTNGQKAVLAEAFVDKVTDKVSDQINDDTALELAQKALGDKLDGYITDENVESIIKENITDFSDDSTRILAKNIRKEILRQVATNVYTTQDALSVGQKREVNKIVGEVVKKAVKDVDVREISDEDIEKIQKNIESNLKGLVSNIISTSNITLSQDTIDKIEKNINISQIVKEELSNNNTVVKEKDIKAIQNNIIESVKESVKTPKKGSDYFTTDEISTIEESSAQKAANMIGGDLNSIKSSITTITSNVSNIQSQISNLSSDIDKKLKELDSSASGSVKDAVSQETAARKELADRIDSNISDINNSITIINSNADALGGKIDIRNSFLRRITSKSGSISKAEIVDTSEMTIAEFVGVLSGNEKEYTTAINQLSYDVTQIKKLIGENFKSLSDECASLSASIDANGDNITTLSEALELESQRRQKAIEGLQTSVSQDMTDVRSKLESYKSASETYAKEQSGENKKALDKAKSELEKTLLNYKGDLNDLSSHVNGIDNATQGKIDNINEQIQAALDSIANGDDTLDEKITSLSGSTSEFITSLQQTIRQETMDRINADIELKEELNKNIQSGIQGVNDAMTALDEAQKAYTDNASAENEKALKEAKEALQNALDSMNQSLSGDIGKLDDATREKIEVVKGNIGDINEKLAADALDIGSLQEGVNGLTENLGTVSSELDSKIAEEKLNRELAIKSLAEQMEEKLNSQISDVNKAMENYNEAQKAYTDNASEENKKALSDAKTELSASISNVQQLLSSDISALSQNSKDAIDKANQTIASVQKILSGAETDIDALQTGVGELQTNLTDVNTNLSNQIAAETAARNLLKDNLNKKIEDVESAMTTLDEAQKAYTDNASAENEKALKAAKAALENSLNTAQESLTEDINDLSSDTAKKFSAVGSSIQSIQENLKTNGDDIESLQNGVDLLGTSVDNLSDSLNRKINDEVAARMELSTTLLSKINQVNSDMTTLENAQKAYTDEKSKKNEDALKAAKSQLESSVSSLETALDSANDSIASLDSATQEKIKTINGTISTVKSQLEASIGDNTVDITNLKGSVSTLTTNITSVNNSLTGKIDDEAKQRKNLETTITGKLSDITDNLIPQAKQAALDGSKKELDKAVSALNKSIDSVQADLTAAKKTQSDFSAATNSSIATINKILDNIKKDAAALTTRTGNVESRATSLESRASTLETAKTTLTNSLNKEISDRTSAITAAISQEVKERNSAIDSKVSAEATARANADTKETNDRTAADKTLQDNISKETTDRKNADSSEATARANADNSEAKARTDADKAINNTIGNASDASGVSGSTIFAKIKTIWTKITELVTKQTNLEKKVNDMNQWCTNIVLKKTTGTNSGKNVYYENVTTGTHKGGIRWKIDGNLVGLTNIKSTSNITIQYNASTPDIVCSYEQGAGYLYVYVDADYKAAALAGNITIDSIQVESEQ